MVQVLNLRRKESGNWLNSQRDGILLNLQPIKVESEDVLKDALKPVRIHLTRLKTCSLSAFDTGMASSWSTRLDRLLYSKWPVLALIDLIRRLA